MRKCLDHRPDYMKVEVKRDIPVVAKTVGDLRSLSTWPPGLALSLPLPGDRYPEERRRGSPGVLMPGSFNRPGESSGSLPWRKWKGLHQAPPFRRSSSGSFATLAAMRRASTLVRVQQRYCTLHALCATDHNTLLEALVCMTVDAEQIFEKDHSISAHELALLLW